MLSVVAFKAGAAAPAAVDVSLPSSAILCLFVVAVDIHPVAKVLCDGSNTRVGHVVYHLVLVRFRSSCWLGVL